MIAAGADLLDLGGESTRPGGGVYGDGAETVPATEEPAGYCRCSRPCARDPDSLSVDTRKAEVATAALAAGADMINDVSVLAPISNWPWQPRRPPA